LIVGDGDGGDACLLEDAPNLLAHLHTEVDVKIRERFVKEDYPGFGRQRARERHSLLLAPGEFVRIGLGARLQSDKVQQLRDARFPVCFAQVREAEGDVLGGSQMRKQCELLEDNANAAVLRRDVRLWPGNGLPVESHDTLVRPFEARDETERRRLSTARRAEERHDLALVDSERQVVYYSLWAKRLRDALDLEDRLRGRARVRVGVGVGVGAAFDPRGGTRRVTARPAIGHRTPPARR
jgi:hypothetical protein